MSPAGSEAGTGIWFAADCLAGVTLAGARMLTRLAADLAVHSAALRLAAAHAAVRDLPRAEGLAAVVGRVSRHSAVAGLVAASQGESAADARR